VTLEVAYRDAGTIHYVRLKSGGYRLEKEWWIEHPRLRDESRGIGTVRCIDRAGRVWVVIDTDIGRMDLPGGYQWDGASLPYLLRWLMSLAFLVASLPHDGGYQAGRGGHFPVDREDEWRERIDDVLRDVGLARGMRPAWVATVFRALRWFGASAFARRRELEDEELLA
jgi:hypothetical protein